MFSQQIFGSRFEMSKLFSQQIFGSRFEMSKFFAKFSRSYVKLVKPQKKFLLPLKLSMRSKY